MCPSADEGIRKLEYTYTTVSYTALIRNTSTSVLKRWKERGAYYTA